MVKENVFKSGKRSFSIFNESAAGMYSALSGRIVNMRWYEEDREVSNLERIKYFKQILKAIAIKRNRFYQLTDEEIKIFVRNTSPVLKAINFADTYEDEIKIVEDNREFFDNLIKSAEEEVNND